MDIIIHSDGTFSLDFGLDFLLSLLVIAIPVFFICRRIMKRRVKPDKPKIIHLAIATILATLIVYILLITVIFVISKYFII